MNQSRGGMSGVLIGAALAMLTGCTGSSKNTAIEVAAAKSVQFCMTQATYQSRIMTLPCFRLTRRHHFKDAESGDYDTIIKREIAAAENMYEDRILVENVEPGKRIVLEGVKNIKPKILEFYTQVT